MATIGRVYRDRYVKDGKEYPLIKLDIRTISTRKTFTISVNKSKWEDGKVGGTLVPNKENYADYDIWANFSNRGESIPSVKVGSINDMISENGLKYKKGKIFDPFIQKESIYFSIFLVENDKKFDENHLYDVIAQPYRKIQANYNEQNNIPPPQMDNSEADIDIDSDEILF